MILKAPVQQNQKNRNNNKDFFFYRFLSSVSEIIKNGLSLMRSGLLSHLGTHFNSQKQKVSDFKTVRESFS
jgi:hypothetical protein